MSCQEIYHDQLVFSGWRYRYMDLIVNHGMNVQALSISLASLKSTAF